MARTHNLRLLQLLQANLTYEEALIVVAHEVGINLSAGVWTLDQIKRLEFMRPIVRTFPEFSEREWTEPLEA